MTTLDDPQTVLTAVPELAPYEAPTVYDEVPEERPVSQPEGAQVLDDARALYRRHFYFPSTIQADVFTIWTAGLTHMRDHNEKFVGSLAPRMYVRASTAGAGKSLLGTFVELTGGRGEVVFAPATTQYGVIQMLSEGHKTVVLDNWDEVKGGKRDGQRDVLLAGMYDYTALFRTGRREDPEAYILGPVCLTAIGDRLRRNEAFKPVEERCVVVDVAKKPRDDKSTLRFDRRDKEHLARAEAVRRSCEAWGKDVAPDYITYRPTDLPVDRMDDRQVDVWEPLVAIADLAGGEWPARIRRALRALVLNEAVEADEDDDPFVRLTPSQRTMVEVAHVLGHHVGDSITTVGLLAGMAELPGGGRWAVPEGTERDRLLKARTMALASDLAVFGVTRSSVKVPASDGSERYVNGWWKRDVLPQVPSDLPTFRPSDLERHAQGVEEDDVPFD